MENQKIKKILIFGHSNIGDICYDMAVVSPLKKNFPDAAISCIISPKGADIAATVKGIDNIIIFDKHEKHKGLRGYLRFINMIRAEKFDLAVILRDIQMHYFLGIKKMLKFSKDSMLMPQLHLAEKYIMFLNANGIDAGPAEFEFKFSDNDLEYAKEVLRQNKAGDDTLRIGIMPLAAWPLKCWPVEKWNQLIERLTSQLGAKVFLFGKTGDSDWDKQVKTDISAKAISLIDRTTVSQSMALIKSLNIFIGPDSSLLHLSSCLGIETIGLYGATDPDFIYPLFHKQNRLISQADLKCMPCYPGPNGGSCNVHEPAECMQAISVEEVWAKINSCIQSPKT